MTEQHTGDEHDDHDHDDHDHAFEWSEMVRIALVGLAAAAVWFHLWEPVSTMSLVGVAGLLIGGWPIFKEALENLIAKRMTMELSMSIAIVAAAAISEFFTALVITLFVLVAEVLEGLTVSRGRRAIRDLLDFLPRAVSVRRAGGIAEVDADTLSLGDAVLVNPGGRIPVDGIVIAGHSFVDQARITGESMPLEKTVGAAVFAGSINQSGALEIRAERIGRDTSYGKIIEAVEQAERSRAPVQRLADRLAGYLVYFALGAALLTYLLTRDSRATISVIIVAGACGIAAGTPLAILGGIGRAARAGAIVKGGLFLEQLGKVNTVVLDKTGTLTYGRPEVRTLLPVTGVDGMALLDAAASAELRSEHPLGRTIVAHAKMLERSPGEPERFGYTPGRGIDATVDGELVLVGNMALMRDRGIAVPADLLAGHPEASEVYVARAGTLLGAIVIADGVRPEAREAIAAIHGMGIETVLLTGDAKAVAAVVARQLGIAEIAADLLPEDKREHVKGFAIRQRYSVIAAPRTSCRYDFDFASYFSAYIFSRISFFSVYRRWSDPFRRTQPSPSLLCLLGQGQMADQSAIERFTKRGGMSAEALTMGSFMAAFCIDSKNAFASAQVCMSLRSASASFSLVSTASGSDRRGRIRHDIRSSRLRGLPAGTISTLPRIFRNTSFPGFLSFSVYRRWSGPFRTTQPSPRPALSARAGSNGRPECR